MAIVCIILIVIIIFHVGVESVMEEIRSWFRKNNH